MKNEKLIVEKKLLRSLERSNANATVIAAQQQVVNQIEEQLRDPEEVTPDNGQITIENSDGSSDVYKVCHTGQRDIKMERALAFLSIILSGKFDSDIPIIVMKASNAKQLGYLLYNFKSEDITDQVDDNWIVVLEGMHRISAALWANANHEADFKFKNVIIKENIEDIYGYIASINPNSLVSTYSTQDQVRVLSKIKTEDKLTQVIDKYVSKGCSISSVEKAILNRTIPSDKKEKAFAEKLSYSEILSKKDTVRIKLGIELLDKLIEQGVKPQKINRHYTKGLYSFFETRQKNEQIVIETLRITPIDVEQKISNSDTFLALLTKTYEENREQIERSASEQQCTSEPPMV